MVALSKAGAMDNHRGCSLVAISKELWTTTVAALWLPYQKNYEQPLWLLSLQRG